MLALARHEDDGGRHSGAKALAIDANLAAIRAALPLKGPREAPLAGAVSAGEAEHFAGRESEVHRLVGAGNGDAVHLQARPAWSRLLSILAIIGASALAPHHQPVQVTVGQP